MINSNLNKAKRYLINNLNVEKHCGKIKGNHSGLSYDEMTIPLIIIDTNSNYSDIVKLKK